MSTISLPNPDSFARKRLNGNRLSYREYASKLSDLVHGNESLGQRPLNWVEISQRFDCDVKFVYQLRDLALELKMLEIVDGIYKKPELAKQKHVSANIEEFKQIPEIQTWWKFMEHSRFGGTLKGRTRHVTNLKILCDTLQIHPSTWITGNTPSEIFKQGDSMIEQFIDLHKNLKSTIKVQKKSRQILKEGGKRAESYLDHLRYTMIQPRNSFSRAFGYKYPDLYSATSSQSVKKFHGNYSDVMLMPEEFETAKKWAIEHHGIDSDFFRWMFFGLESCARKQAIKGAQSQFSEIDFRGRKAYVMSVFESKTEHLKKGIYKKYITIPELQDSILSVSKRSAYLIEDRSLSNIDFIYDELKKLYRFLHIDKKWLAHHDDLTSGYVMNHATHALRHFGCQLWLQRLGFSAISLVAIMGGWNTMDEALSSYGAISDTMLLDEVGKVWTK